MMRHFRHRDRDLEDVYGAAFINQPEYNVIPMTIVIQILQQIFDYGDPHGGMLTGGASENKYAAYLSDYNYTDYMAGLFDTICTEIGNQRLGIAEEVEELVATRLLPLFRHVYQLQEVRCKKIGVEHPHRELYEAWPTRWEDLKRKVKEYRITTDDSGINMDVDGGVDAKYFVASDPQDVRVTVVLENAVNPDQKFRVAVPTNNVPKFRELQFYANAKFSTTTRIYKERNVDLTLLEDTATGDEDFKRWLKQDAKGAEDFEKKLFVRFDGAAGLGAPGGVKRHNTDKVSYSVSPVFVLPRPCGCVRISDGVRCGV